MSILRLESNLGHLVQHDVRARKHHHNRYTTTCGSGLMLAVRGDGVFLEGGHAVYRMHVWHRSSLPHFYTPPIRLGTVVP